MGHPRAAGHLAAPRAAHHPPPASLAPLQATRSCSRCCCTASRLPALRPLCPTAHAPSPPADNVKLQLTYLDLGEAQYGGQPGAHGSSGSSGGSGQGGAALVPAA